MMEPRGLEPLPPACHEVAKSDATYFAIPYAENDKLGFFIPRVALLSWMQKKNFLVLESF